MTQKLNCPAITNGTVGGCRSCLFYPDPRVTKGGSYCLIIIERLDRTPKATCDYEGCQNELRRPVLLEENGIDGKRIRWFCQLTCLNAQVALEQAKYETG